MMFRLERCRLVYFLPLLLLCSCGSSTPQTTVVSSPVVTPAPVQPAFTPPPAQNVPNSFAAWLADFKREALSKGITQPVLDDAFANVTQPLQTVLERDNTQPEKTKTFDEYLSGVLKPKTVEAAREQWQSHEDILADVQKAYDVPPQVLLALWQSESVFGKVQGKFSIIDSLATLAYDGRRSAFFRTQLLDALTLLQQEHMPASELTGSWAGAMGQTQFMPQSFLAFAVDFDGDGKKDIWKSDADALASMANYLHTRGWDGESGWGLHVKVPAHANVQEWVDSKEKLGMAQWSKRGIKRFGGGKLPKDAPLARLVIVDKDPDYAYLVYPNYDVIMDWNRSTYFATSVNLLADAIAKK